MFAKSKKFKQHNKRYIVMYIIIAALFVLFSFLSEAFFSWNTLISLFIQSAAVAFSAIGMTFIILTGKIDLSVGSVVALAGCVAALTMQAMNPYSLFTAVIGVVITLVVPVIVGVISGIMIGYLGVNAFIVTLAVMSIARGLTFTLSNAARVLIPNPYYNALHSTTLFGEIPIVIPFLVIAYIVAWLLLTKTTFGRKTYAVGDNPIAARASGIAINRHTIMVYAVSGLFVGMAAIMLAARSQTAQPTAGLGLEFNVITAVVIGGISLSGGQGSIKGTVLGVTVSAIIFTGMGLMNVSPFYVNIIRGVLLLIAVMSTQINWGAKTKVDDASVALSKILEKIKSDKQKTLSLKDISKSFPGVKALENVNLDLRRGCVHALCGENGAGKSTLIKILSGVHTKDAGEILVDGVPINIKSSMDSQKLGVSVIYQELALVPELKVYQNIYLGKEIENKFKFLLDAPRMIKNSKAILSKMDLNIKLTSKVSDLTVGQQQMVEIVKAIMSNAWIVVMDEPTSAISEVDKKNLFKIIADLKEQGVAIVYITHRMQEIFEIADDVTVLRDGQHVVTLPVDQVDEQSLIKYMVGRELHSVFDREKNEIGEVVLEVKDLYRKGVFEPISFKVYKGEVLGFSGIIGAGRTEIMRCIFGLDKPDGGEIYLGGTQEKFVSPSDAIEAGVMYVSEDRRREGIIPHLSIRENISLPSLKWLSKLGFVALAKEKDLAQKYIDLLSIRTPSQEQMIGNLSGGNQQKVCLGKWLARRPKVIILDEPTRGIDVAAKSEIHKLIAQLAEEGIGVILISSEMPEIIGASDRVIVLHEGVAAAELDDTEFTQERIMAAASGVG